MSFNISDKALNSMLNRHLNRAQKRHVDSLAKLASGSRFAGSKTMPAERAISENMEFRVRSLQASKRNINDAISLLQTAETGMTEINNIITRMKEINITAASTTLNDQERRFLFVEYEALHSEINRIAQTTEFNGIPLLNGSSENAPEELIFRVDDPFYLEEDFGFDDPVDLNSIKLQGMKGISATTGSLGLLSAQDMLEDTTDYEGIELEDVEEMLIPEDSDLYATTYDQALSTLATQRAVFGALQTRLQHSLDYVDVYKENLEAARSKIADTDYVEEISEMIQAKMSTHATTSLMAQSNINAKQTLQLLSSIS